MTQFYSYSLHLEADPDGGFVATCPDVPEAITQGETRKETISNAQDALLTALQGYMRLRRPFPVPIAVPVEGTPQVSLPELAQAKVLLYNAMVEGGVSNAELSRRMGKASENQVRRILNPHTRVHFEDIARAIGALHLRLVFGVERVA